MLKFPTFEKLIHTSVLGRGGRASTVLGLSRGAEGLSTPLYQVSLHYMHFLSLLFFFFLALPTVNLSIKGINPGWLRLRNGGLLVGDLAAPET